MGSPAEDVSIHVTVSSTCSATLCQNKQSAGHTSPLTRVALEGKGPQRGGQMWLARRLEEVAQAVGAGYCRLQTPLRLAVRVRETMAGHRLGALEGGYLHPFQFIPAPGTPQP